MLKLDSKLKLCVDLPGVLISYGWMLDRLLLNIEIKVATCANV
jgi:hypothetical protein